MQPIILFDGDCLFCHASVQWVAARDRKAVFRFASQQSAVGRALLERENGLAGGTVVLIEDGCYYVKSDAVLRIGRRLAWPWNMLAAAGFLVPRPLRNFVYDQIAVRRHRLIRQHDRCPLPPPELRARFLDELPR
ncbi:DCC1-like thiol-disulfide oxidoreductase family protein [Geobacillus sp. FSL W8-0032]|uniref:thiol-disulfide oxidoreductase DCC family protein n=1 Tax=unclassified Geobacillus TaxID=2642459 RepID=UPI0030D90790